MFPITEDRRTDEMMKIDCKMTDTKNGEIFVMMGVNNKDKSSTENVQVHNSYQKLLSYSKIRVFLKPDLPNLCNCKSILHGLRF